MEERTRSLAAFEEQRRRTLLEGLQDAVAESGKVRYRLAAAQSRARAGGYGGALQEGPTVRAVIYRNKDGASRRLEADIDTALQPGDVVEIVTAAAFQSAGLPPAMQAGRPAPPALGGSADSDTSLAPARLRSAGTRVP